MMLCEYLDNIISIIKNYAVFQITLNNVMLTGRTYDLLKKSIIWIWNNIRGKRSFI